MFEVSLIKLTLFKGKNQNNSNQDFHTTQAYGTIVQNYFDHHHIGLPENKVKICKNWENT